MKKMVIAVLLAAFIAEPAIAASKNYYAGGKLGLNNINSASSAAFGVLGGYMLDPDLAVEAAYIDLGSIKDKVVNDTVKFTVLEVGAVATFMVNRQYSVFAKLGVAKMSESGLGLPKINRIAPTWGLGSHSNFRPNIVVRFSLDSYSFGDSFIRKRGNSMAYSISGLYKF